MTFRDYVQGTWGSFDTPAGRVDYIMTKARLGGDADAPERQLTKSLAPVREVMDSGDLDFNQLLQRDLDDHRVAVNLIPYLLKPQATGPAFFPPIMAVLLPFKNKRPTSFPMLDTSKQVEHDDALWQEERAGNAFRVHRLLGVDGELHGANVGKLWWNQSEASLVVLDGQHRAMALLAVERTLSRTWQGNGEQFRPFYEHQVERLLNEYQVSEVDLAKIEVPVTVCWFPCETGESSRPHESARKLFVDVNKEARPPSESRIILLSDGELVNVLTRSLLSALRGRNGAHLPLYGVEYDNPEINTSRPARWSVMTNIHLLKMAVNRCIFGPPKYLINLAQPISGREKAEERDEFMRTQLDLASLLPDYLDDAGYPYDRDAIGDRNFPLGRAEAIAGRFMETWGLAILTLLSQTAPYAAHAEGLARFKESWHTANTHAALAHDALFGGVGIYWTLRDSYDHYQDAIRRLNGPKPPKSDVIRAWETLKEKESEFDEYRAHAYVGSTRRDVVKRCKAAFGVFNTHACQLGLIMTLASLWEMRKNQPGGADIKDLPAFSAALVAGWNTFFKSGGSRARDRRYAFTRDCSHPINQISNMDTPNAVYFRYFWMQALATSSAWRHLDSWLPNRDAFDAGLSAARHMYLDLCIKQKLKALESSDPLLGPERRIARAKKLATAELQKALHHWFDVLPQEFEAWLASEVSRGNQVELDLANEVPAPEATDASNR
ncbi:DNA sulfur modification protein DndB [Streptoalloteichus tenebrarius]|uniref:DNA sulfur modification protein DndB n=1 Tax=Streptoalloteichus tenebrarius (strain ATCC 17920 / DSM 40477 / JCM 4838 / CBS 697.72 / NBRC 16177 / NCIMB 11028 / NRRL B-12390 / A12253. 1 / ISP 5477) TaxID=1933 RepID=UPI0020A2D9E2|nr:DNA sulfur modification protein DndB [Streptoalloteichus tenebrarius]